MLQLPPKLHNSRIVAPAWVSWRNTDLLAGERERGVEPLLEGGAALEDRWEEEVEEGPELGKLVLQRKRRVHYKQNLGKSYNLDEN